MFFDTLIFLFGIGPWNSGLESLDISPRFENIAPIEKKWSFAPFVSAESILIMDLDSAMVLYEKNGYKSLPMASLTKIMTALIIVENTDLSSIVEISKGSGNTSGSTMKLLYGEKISVENLLYGLLMNSGNDAAIALSRYHSGSTVYEFVKTMNIRAQDLGLTKTHYSNPHGLDSESHYSSANDIAKLTKKLLSFPVIRKIVSTQKITVTSVDGLSSHTLVNTNQLLGGIYPIYGMKTGTTDQAGECLVLLVRSNGREYIIVILGSQDRYLDAKALLWKLLL